ncbi:hypothetical protein DRP05_10675 [Archaeoglobales archaeon]|nr:MAG: hypothetical protein DRP05_10675 [Archaeoglobales archaeon]
MVSFESFKTIIHEISAIVGEEDVSTQDSVRYAYSFDTSLYSGKAIGVVKPENVEEVCEILKIANKYKIPVVPRGFGTGNRGGVVPYNALVLDMTKFNSFSIDPKNLMLEADSGVIFSKLRGDLDRKELFLPPEPDFDTCTIGGYVATSKSGRRTLKYGNIKDYVVGLDAILPNGEFVELGSKSFKYSGIDIKDLFIGSEGVLGVITKVYCKVLPKPKDFAVVIVKVENLRMGVELAIEILNEILPTSIEYVDTVCSKVMGMEGEMIAIELDSYTSVDDEVDLIEKLSGDYGDVEVYKGKHAEKFYDNLKFLNVKLKNYFDGFPVVEDFEIPITTLPFVCEEIEKIVKRNKINYGMYCHLDSGVVHPILFFEDLSLYEVLLNELCEVVKRYRGYIAGEYGIGVVKSKFLDENVVKVVKEMKKLLDPNNIMNPGKMGL